MEELHFNADITGERIDKFLDGRIESLSRSYIQKLIKEKKILVNQLPVKANYKLTTGDTIILQIPDPEPLDIQPENIPLDILYEDDDILVVNNQKEWLYILHRDITAIHWSMRFYITVEKTCRESMV